MCGPWVAPSLQRLCLSTVWCKVVWKGCFYHKPSAKSHFVLLISPFERFHLCHFGVADGLNHSVTEEKMPDRCDSQPKPTKTKGVTVWLLTGFHLGNQFKMQIVLGVFSILSSVHVSNTLWEVEWICLCTQMAPEPDEPARHLPAFSTSPYRRGASWLSAPSDKLCLRPGSKNHMVWRWLVVAWLKVVHVVQHWRRWLPVVGTLNPFASGWVWDRVSANLTLIACFEHSAFSAPDCSKPNPKLLECPLTWSHYTPVWHFAKMRILLRPLSALSYGL